MQQRTFTIRFAQLVIMEKQFTVDIPAGTDEDTAQNMALTEAARRQIEGRLRIESGDDGSLIAPPGAVIDDISDEDSIWGLVGETPTESADDDDNDDNWDWGWSDRDQDRTRRAVVYH